MFTEAELAILKGFIKKDIGGKMAYICNCLTDDICYAIFDDIRATNGVFPAIIYSRANDCFESDNYLFIQVKKDGSYDKSQSLEVWYTFAKMEQKARKAARQQMKMAA